LKYTNDINDVRAIGFATIEHAIFMTEKFNLAGLKAESSSKNSVNEIELESI
jgi:hypothetical protein